MTKKFNLGEIVWDSNNKRYGVVIGIYDDNEVRLDSDGMQPIEDLYPLGDAKDKGTKKKLIEAIHAYSRLIHLYPKNNYPQLLCFAVKYRVKNVVTEMIVGEFKTDNEFTYFMRKVAVENDDEDLSITCISEAMDYLNNYCSNLKLIN